MTTSKNETSTKVKLPVDKPQVIAIDLGNTATNIQSMLEDYEGPSYYIDSTSNSQEILLPQQKSDLMDFELKNDPGKTFRWGIGLRNIKVPEGVVETRSEGNRYLEKPFRNLMEMALGAVAYAEDRVEPLTKQTIQVNLSIGLPTDDYEAQRFLQNSDKSFGMEGEVVDNYIAFLKGDHHVKVNGKAYTIQVLNITVSDQPQGTLTSEAFDAFGRYKNPEILDGHTTIIDCGGLTDLISQYQRGRRFNKAAQLNEGAFRLAANVASRWNKSKNANPHIKVTQEDVLRMLYGHDPEDETYIIHYNKREQYDVTDIVKDEINRATQEVIELLKGMKGWDTSDNILVTGGASYLINYDMLNDFLNQYGLEAIRVEDPKVANVRGFYIMGLLKNQEAAKHYIKYVYDKEQGGAENE